MTAVEWIEQRLKDTYDWEGKLPIAYTLDLVKQAKELEEEENYQEYMKGYQKGWRECDEQIKNDIKILNNKYNL